MLTTASLGTMSKANNYPRILRDMGSGRLGEKAGASRFFYVLGAGALAERKRGIDGDDHDKTGQPENLTS